MIRSLIVLLLAVLSSSLVLEVNNIHYGYRNIYNSKSASISGSLLTLRDYVTTKLQLTDDVLGFLTADENSIVVEMNLLAKQYDVSQLDPTNPFLMFKFTTKPHIIISISSENQEESKVDILNQLATQGQDISQQL